MRNVSKITTLESKFPLLSVEQGCMVSKDADITVAFRMELPELFTVTSTEYEAMHSAWHRTQAGLVHQGGLSRKALQWRVEFPCPCIRTALQRTSLPAPFGLSLPDQNNQTEIGTTEQLFFALPWASIAQGNLQQGRSNEILGSRGSV